MITEDYVSFETAKLLKEKGFEQPFDYGKWFPKITIQMAMKWLREKHSYQIIVTPEYSDVEYMPGQWQEESLGWKYTIIPFNGNKSIMYPSVYSSTAESAYEAAIKYCLENLI